MFVDRFAVAQREGFTEKIRDKRSTVMLRNQVDYFPWKPCPSCKAYAVAHVILDDYLRKAW